MTDTQTDHPKQDVYQRITDQIVAAIEAGSGPIEMPWHQSGVATTRPANAFTAQSYQGVNILSLWAAAVLNEFTSGYWATFKQWHCLGARVRKGEKSSPIVFYKRYVAGHPSDQGHQMNGNQAQAKEGTTPVRWFARTTSAFNVEQVEGWSPPSSPVRSPAQILSGVEAFVARTHADIRHEGDSACYRPEPDVILMPAREAFTGTGTSNATESYYAVLFHELTHWSGHHDRLDRELANRFGDEAYAMEELVAELGASFLCAENAIANEPRPDHACYIANWLEVLKNDKRAVFPAARKASEATAFLMALQTKDAKEALSHIAGEQS
jgi:antirestriction protein ArdC